MQGAGFSLSAGRAFTELPHSGRSEFAQRPFVVGLGTCARMRGGAFLARSVRSLHPVSDFFHTCPHNADASPDTMDALRVRETAFA